MINGFMEIALGEMRDAITALERELSRLDAAFVEPDTCTFCQFYRGHLGHNGDWSCGNPKSPLYPGYSWYQSASYMLCCIHFKPQECEEGKNENKEEIPF